MILLHVVVKRSGEGTRVSANEVSLKEASIVRVDLPKQQVKGMRRVGTDLVITAVSGEIVTVRGFFSPFDGNKSDLVLDEGQGGSWFAGLSQEHGELAVSYSEIDSIEPLMMPKASDFGVWPWLLGGGLLHR
ncbi:BapA prefix-like domain-containing protein, partial [Variovorax sp. SCN 67-20]|uniref:BapA/Bap/LapF family prefix-like domain-containing protein n=1 Tax=Variovorax sp. SCN 67-20 TaxID=1660153 RepID=UPI0025CFE3DD